jgi:hypothetical protein
MEMQFEMDSMNKHLPKLVEFSLLINSLFHQYTTEIHKDGQGWPFEGEFPTIRPGLTGVYSAAEQTCSSVS